MGNKYLIEETVDSREIRQSRGGGALVVTHSLVVLENRMFMLTVGGFGG